MNQSRNKKRIITSIILGIVIITIAITQFAYGNDFNKEQTAQSGFFTTDKTNVAQNSYVTMNIDLSSIDYENFKFTLTADSNLEGNVSQNTESTSNANEMTTNADGNTITITAKKSEIELGKIILYYKVPTTLAIGSNITLTAKIESLDETQNNTVSNNETVNNTITGTNSIVQTNQTTINTSVNNTTSNSTSGTNSNTASELYKVATVQLTVVKEENTNVGNNTTGQNQSNTNNMQLIQNNSNIGQEQKMTETATSSSQSKQTTTSKTSTSETYKGSYINYLTDISINGYSIVPEFSMTNTTYMLEVENDVESIDISTTKYDSSSIVKIYGNNNLQVGQNKVLISVTAENGSVRTYRIYVTRKAE